MDDETAVTPRILGTGAYEAALAAIMTLYSRDTGQAASALYMSAVAVGRRIDAGAAFDVAITTPEALDGLASLQTPAAATRAARGLACSARAVRATRVKT